MSKKAQNRVIQFFKDASQIQLEKERAKRREKIDDERSAREQRRQKRLMRNELPTSENKESFKNIDWSTKEIIREFGRVKALRKRDMRNRRKRCRARYSSRNRRGSVNTEEEPDLFENPEDFDWPDAEPIVRQKQKSTNSGRQVNKPENKDEEENESETLKIMMEANMYRLLGIQERGLEEMKIFWSKADYYKKSEVPELKDKIWIKGEWVLSGDNSRSKMEYIKNKDFWKETHGEMINILKQLVLKRDIEKKAIQDKILKEKEEEEKLKNNVEKEEVKDHKEEVKEFKKPDSVPTSENLDKIPDIQKKILQSKERPEVVNSKTFSKVFMIQKDFQHRTVNRGHSVE